MPNTYTIVIQPPPFYTLNYVGGGAQGPAGPPGVDGGEGPVRLYDDANAEYATIATSDGTLTITQAAYGTREIAVAGSNIVTDLIRSPFDLVINGNGGKIQFQTGGFNRWQIGPSNHFYPSANNSFDIGTAALRVAGYYGTTLNLSGAATVNSISESGATATGTGGLVRATSPTLTTPNIGAATGSTLSLSSGGSDGSTVLTLANSVGSAQFQLHGYINTLRCTRTIDAPGFRPTNGNLITSDGTSIKIRNDANSADAPLTSAKATHSGAANTDFMEFTSAGSSFMRFYQDAGATGVVLYGGKRVGIGNNTSILGQLHVESAASTTKTLVLRQATSQSVNVFETQNQAGTVEFSVGQSGALTAGTVAATTVSVSGTGGTGLRGSYNSSTVSSSNSIRIDGAEIWRSNGPIQLQSSNGSAYNVLVGTVTDDGVNKLQVTGGIAASGAVTCGNVTASGTVTAADFAATPVTFAGLPPASANTGKSKQVSDRDYAIATSNGTNWLRAGTSTVLT